MVINPPGVFGPPITDRADGSSIDMVRQVFEGKLYPACPDIGGFLVAHTQHTVLGL